jgi:starvation-inducible DNA-binding protein
VATRGHQLQATLIELSLFGKQLHSSVVGPHVRPLHDQLDGLVDSWRELADRIAEHVLAIGTRLLGETARPCA